MVSAYSVTMHDAQELDHGARSTSNSAIAESSGALLQ